MNAFEAAMEAKYPNLFRAATEGFELCPSFRTEGGNDCEAAKGREDDELEAMA